MWGWRGWQDFTRERLAGRYIFRIAFTCFLCELLITYRSDSFLLHWPLTNDLHRRRFGPFQPYLILVSQLGYRCDTGILYNKMRSFVKYNSSPSLEDVGFLYNMIKFWEIKNHCKERFAIVLKILLQILHFNDYIAIIY